MKLQGTNCWSWRSAKRMSPVASRLIVRPRYNPALNISLTVCVVTLLFSVGGKAQEHHKSNALNPSSPLPQVHVNTATITLPIIDRMDIRFTHLSTADDLSQTKVYEIAQDDQGFMWFSTLYGLNRYDGYNFKAFAHDPGNPNSLTGVGVDALFKDRAGALWASCGQFLNKLDPVTEKSTRYPVPFVSQISQDTAGMLWLATPTGGLYSLDPAKGSIRQYSHDSNDPSTISSDDVIYTGEDREGRFWVATAGFLDEFDRKTGRVTRHIPIPEAPFGFGFYEDRFGVFWIFHVSPYPLAVFDRKTNSLTHYSFTMRDQIGTAVTRVTAMLEDRNGALWIATHGSGLLKFDRDHSRFIRYRNDPGDPESLPQDSVDTLFIDHEGSIWAGLGSKGPVRLGADPPPFTKLANTSRRPNTTDPFVGAIYEDRQGILWLGTPAALVRIDRKTGRLTSYRNGEPEIATDVITIREDRSGGLWVGTYGHGLLRFDRRTGKFKTYRHDAANPHSLSNDFVSRLLVDHNGTLWAGTMDGLNRFDAATDGFTSYKLEAQGRLPYLELVEDRFGLLWLGTDSSGLRSFDPATGQIAAYQHDESRPGTLSDNRVNSVYFDRSGTMWVGTQNGLDQFDPRTKTFKVYTQRNGLPGVAVGCVLEDKQGHLWMSTNNGMARFDQQTGTFNNYSTADGLPGPNLTGWGACFKSPSGEMFFGGFSGATAFFPDDVVGTSYTPPIVLTDFRLLGIPVEIGGHSPLQTSISYAKDLTLSRDQDAFSLTFATLSYSDPGTSRYRYRLEGLQRDWIEVGSDQRQATYNTLSAGKYTFRVQGATRTGAWSQPGVVLHIEILPPWWGTWWFRMISVFLLFFVGLAAYKYRVRQVARSIGARFDERLAERTRMARELHDTFLQTIQGSKLVVDDVLERPPDPLQMRRALERLSVWLERATREGRAALNSLRTSTTEKNNLAGALRRATEECQMQKPMEVSFSVVGDAKEMHPVVRDEVYRIGYEAIRNACMHSKGSRLEVGLTYSQDLAVRVSDNGVGIDPTVAYRGKEGHFGLEGMRERAARIGSKLKVVSEENSGTEVTLVIPGGIVFRKAGATRFEKIKTIFGE